MNKTAIQTYNFLREAHEEKRQEYLKQSHKTSGDALKVGSFVQNAWLPIEIELKWIIGTEISLIKLFYENLSLFPLCLWRSDLGILIVAVSISHTGTRMFGSDQLVAEFKTHTTRTFMKLVTLTNSHNS
jgi:hypothetical protein